MSFKKNIIKKIENNKKKKNSEKITVRNQIERSLLGFFILSFYLISFGYYR